MPLASNSRHDHPAVAAAGSFTSGPDSIVFFLRLLNQFRHARLFRETNSLLNKLPVVVIRCFEFDFMLGCRCGSIKTRHALYRVYSGHSRVATKWTSQ